MLPMLAHRYDRFRFKLQYPCHIQPKLNGLRMLYQDGICQSRDEHMWSSDMLLEIRSALQNLSPHILLDGELYHHGWSLQAINSAAGVNRILPNAQTHLIEYHVFDCIFIQNPTLSFSERHALLRTVMVSIPYPVRLVQTDVAFTPDGAELRFGEWKRMGYEGMMYRESASPYGLKQDCGNQENRWAYLIKRKDWLDDEFACVGVEEGEGKYRGAVGALVFVARNGTNFSAGSGLSDEERKTYYDNPPVGKFFRIRYEMLSDIGKPLKPTIECEMS